SAISSDKGGLVSARRGDGETAYGGLMFRMLTLIWALGMLLLTSPAQAVAPMGENAGSTRTETVSEAQRGQTAHLITRQSSSVHRRTARAVHEAPARASRYRRSMKLAQAGSAQRKTRKARRWTSRKRPR